MCTATFRLPSTYRPYRYLVDKIRKQKLTLKRLETSAANTCCGPLNPSPSAPAARGGNSPPPELSAASSCDALMVSPFPISMSWSGHAAWSSLIEGEKKTV